MNFPPFPTRPSKPMPVYKVSFSPTLTDPYADALEDALRLTNAKLAVTTKERDAAAETCGRLGKRGDTYKTENHALLASGARAESRIAQLVRDGDGMAVENTRLLKALASSEGALAISAKNLVNSNDRISHLVREVNCMAKENERIKADLTKANAVIAANSNRPYGARPYDPIVETLFGRPVEEWARLDRVMLSSRATVEDVESQLRGRRYGAAEPSSANSLEVFDSRNPKRLLGTLIDAKKRFGHLKGPRIEVGVMPRAVTVDYRRLGDAICAPTYYRASFEIGHIEDPTDTWTLKTVLRTDTPLEQLLRLDFFRLPGETTREAARRFNEQR